MRLDTNWFRYSATKYLTTYRIKTVSLGAYKDRILVMRAADRGGWRMSARWYRNYEFKLIQKTIGHYRDRTWIVKAYR